MKRLITVVLALALVFALTACTEKAPETTPAPQEPTKAPTDTEPTAEPAPEMTKIRVGYHTNLGGAGCVITCEKMGYFAEEGLEVELVPFTSGPPEIAAMSSGDLQFAYIGNGAHALAINGKAEIIAPLQIGNSEKIIARKDSGISTLADLKGKKVATTFGTSGEAIVDLALEKAGLERGTGKDQVNVINMETGGCVTAIIAGQVDAVCVWEQYLVSVNEGLGDNAVTLAETIDFKDKYIAISSYLTTEKLMQKDPELCQRFVNALEKGLKYQEANQEEVAKWVAELIKVDEAVVLKGVGSAEFLTPEKIKTMMEDGTLDQIFQLQQDKFISAEKVDGKVPLNEYLHLDFIKKAVDKAMAE